MYPADPSSMNYDTIFEFAARSAIDHSLRKDAKQEAAQEAAKSRKRELGTEDDGSWALEGETDLDKSNLGFDWTVVEHGPRRVSIKLHFEHGAQLSATPYGNDMLMTRIKNYGVFECVENGLRLDEDSFVETDASGAAVVNFELPTMGLSVKAAAALEGAA